MLAELQIGGNYVRGVHQRAAAGGGFRAYLAVPEAGSGPGLVLLHDIADDDRDLRELGDLYAAEGTSCSAQRRPPSPRVSRML